MNAIDIFVTVLMFLLFLVLALAFVGFFAWIYFKFKEKRIKKDIPNKFIVEVKNGKDRHRGDSEGESGDEVKVGDTGDEEDTIGREGVSIPSSEDLKFN